MVKDKAGLSLIGCGNMGASLLKGWLSAGADKEYEIGVMDPLVEEMRVRHELTENNSVKFSANLDNLQDILTSKGSITVVAVKPHQMGGVLRDLNTYLGEGSIVLSLAAGVDTNFMTEKLRRGIGVGRVMPNLPVAINKGLSFAFASSLLSEDSQSKSRIERLFEYVGRFYWLSDENDLHATTAFAGSGPAYLYAFCEILSEAGESLGLSSESAWQGARDIIVGASLLMEGSNKSARLLRQEVTSPKGTTEAALEVLLEKDIFADLMKRALQGAQERSRQLADEANTSDNVA